MEPKTPHASALQHSIIRAHNYCCCSQCVTNSTSYGIIIIFYIAIILYIVLSVIIIIIILYIIIIIILCSYIYNIMMFSQEVYIYNYIYCISMINFFL